MEVRDLGVVESGRSYAGTEYARKEDRREILFVSRIEFVQYFRDSVISLLHLHPLYIFLACQ